MSQISLLDLLTKERPALSVAELTDQIREILEVGFYDILVEGEISNFKPHSSGHWYFTLKDEQAQIRCAAFRNQNLYIRFRPKDGLKVRVRGRISVYESRGDYQIIVNQIEPRGKGSLQQAFEELQARLFAEGLFDEINKQPLPRIPLVIGIITSPTGAAIQDILQILNRRNQTVSVLIYPTKVQGEGAANEIITALNYFHKAQNVDVIILARGGGSIEDLWAFNEEAVARAIFRCSLPIISAIGHEIDFTIADFVADCRAPTPSAAAELVVARQDELEMMLLGYRDNLISLLQYQLLTARTQVTQLRASNVYDRLPAQLRRYEQQLDNLKHRLETATRLLLQQHQEALDRVVLDLANLELRSMVLARSHRLQQLQSRLQTAGQGYLQNLKDRLHVSVGKMDTLSPLAVLARGYALVLNSQGQLVKNANQVSPGDKVRVRVAEGEMICIRDLE